MRPILFHIERLNKETGERLYLSQKMRRWLPKGGKHRIAKVSEDIAELFIDKMKGSEEEKKYYYLKAIA